MGQRVNAFHKGKLGASDYWLRFEWQHCGSPHVHGLAWLEDAPNVETFLSQTGHARSACCTSDTGANLSADSSTDAQATVTVDVTADPDASGGSVSTTAEGEFLEYVDRTVTTVNPAVLTTDGSNVADAPQPKTDLHICNKPYSEVTNFHQDLVDLIATCQCHTRCSSAYKPLLVISDTSEDDNQNGTSGKDKEPALITARNDGCLNSFNPVQLSSWRANVDMQYCICHQE